MGKKEESNPFSRPYNFTMPQDQTPNNALPHWSTSMQSYYNPGSTPTPFYNQFAAGPYLYHPYMWQNQANNALLQCDALHDPARLSNKPHVAEDAALAFAKVVHRNLGERNPDFNKLFSGNLHPLSLTSGVSRECGNQSSAPKDDKDGASTSAASGSKRSSDENQDDTNKDFPLSKKQKSDLIIGDENPSGLTQNLETVVKESDADVEADAQLKYTEDDDIRKERKRQSNRESAKRSRIRKQQECEELCKNIDTLKDENSVLTQRLVALSEECLELTNENESIQEELIKKYGRESIQDLLLLMKPA
ncbi:hypothetical protein P8452_06872 [Trifolium repens]|nr:hypothetical protein P8452_06872 [Trifolium repens]